MHFPPVNPTASRRYKLGRKKPSSESTPENTPKTTKEWIQVIVALIAAIATIAAALIAIIPVLMGDPPATLTTPTVSIPSTSTQAQNTLTGKMPPTNSDQFSVTQFYKPTQHMGDRGDINISGVGNSNNPILFTYSAYGNGPHEWDYKYVSKEINPNPARFAGIMFIDSAGPGGTDPNNGFDLSAYKTIKWEARSIQDSVDVKFVIGGVTWVWDEQTKERVSAPYPDSIKSSILMCEPTLTAEWQSFEYDISGFTPDMLQHVVGVFGWTIDWGDNNIISITNPDASIVPENPRNLVIEIRNIYYDKAAIANSARKNCGS